MRDFISVEEEVTADAKEGFSKNYSFPTGRDTNNDDYQKEGDDDEDEMTHGEHTNDVTNEKDDVISDEARRLNKVLSQLDDLDVDKDAADKDMAGIKSKNDILHHIPGESMMQNGSHKPILGRRIGLNGKIW